MNINDKKEKRFNHADVFHTPERTMQMKHPLIWFRLMSVIMSIYAVSLEYDSYQV